MKPQFTIIPRIKNSAINPGEIVCIDLFILGAVDETRDPVFDKARLVVRYEYDSIFDTLGSYSHEDLGFNVTEDIIGFYQFPLPHPEGGFEGMKMPMDFGTFEPSPIRSIVRPLSKDEKEYSDDSFPVLFSEGMFGLHDGTGYIPPLYLELQLSDKCSPGDYKIFFVFMYEADGEISLIREDATFHVNNFQERHNTGITIITYIAVMIALAALIVQGIDVLGIQGADVLEFIQ